MFYLGAFSRNDDNHSRSKQKQVEQRTVRARVIPEVSKNLNLEYVQQQEQQSGLITKAELEYLER